MEKQSQNTTNEEAGMGGKNKTVRRNEWRRNGDEDMAVNVAKAG